MEDPERSRGRPGGRPDHMAALRARPWPALPRIGVAGWRFRAIRRGRLAREARSVPSSTSAPAR